ncbi:hypothetical protein D3C72_1915010 [compost metagenome]
MEIDIAEAAQVHGQRQPFAQHLLVDAFASGIDHARQVHDGADFQPGDVFGRRRQIQVKDLQVIRFVYHSTVSRRV